VKDSLIRYAFLLDSRLRQPCPRTCANLQDQSLVPNFQLKKSGSTGTTNEAGSFFDVLATRQPCLATKTCVGKPGLPA